MLKILLKLALKKELTYPELVRFRSPRYRKKILSGEDGNALVAEMIESKRPLMISRLGGNELKCVQFYVQSRLKNNRKYSEDIKDAMTDNAGFFPAEDAHLDRFSAELLEHLRHVDLMGLWFFNEYEPVACNTWCSDAALVDAGCLEPFRFQSPWSLGLAGKKVLVVHPFAASIQKQYTEKRKLLFANQDVLPQFELKTLKAVQSIAGAKTPFANWFEALEHMCNEINNVEFDIAIIGAGAYGLHLASYVKGLGKQAIHLGGVTQVLFGIKGRRWEVEYANSTGKLFNEHLVRPLESEIPLGHIKVEDGCYW